MNRFSSTRRSPATVVAFLALMLALTGGAVAGTKAVTSMLNGKEKKQVKKIAKKQANKQIKNAAPGLSVAHASTAGSATSATNATNATNAGNAENAANAINATNASHATNADAVGGVTVQGFRYQTPSNGGPETLLEMRGLSLEAICSAGRLDARTSVSDAYISSSWVTPGDAAIGDSDSDFDTTDTFLTNVNTGAKAGSIEYVRPDGQRVSVTLQADMAAACTVSGHAFASG